MNNKPRAPVHETIRLRPFSFPLPFAFCFRSPQSSVMPAFRFPLLAALALLPLCARGAGAVLREPGAVYLEDFLSRPVKLTTLSETTIYYKSDLARYLGTVRKGEIVELQAVGETAYRVRAKAQQGQVVGWLSPEVLTPLNAEFLENLRKNAARKAEVEALIEKNEVAINMTQEEVGRALGKVSKKTSRLDAKGREEVWEFVRYERVPQQVTGYDRYGRLVNSITYVKVPSGKLAVTFSNNLVTSLEQTEGTFERDARVKIVTAPYVIAY
jgi:hypothetical protein